MSRLLALAAAMSLLAVGRLLAGQPAPGARTDLRVGGANAPPPGPPPKLVISTGELAAGAFTVKVPTGAYAAPPAGAPNYAVPGPIAAVKGADGAWRGHGYLETYPRLLKFQGTLAKDSAELSYTFERGKSYTVKLEARNGALLMDETSDLGPRNLYVFDCYYGNWLPAAGFALDLGARHHAFLYLPCHYDKAEVTIRPAQLTRSPAAATAPAGLAVLSAEPAKRDVVGFLCRDLAGWRNADRMGLQLWQRRQLPGDPGSRHFLGPETKSDSTPNPRTAAMLGTSLYEGHVTIELSLGVGTRRLGFAAAPKGKTRATLPEPFRKLAAAD